MPAKPYESPRRKQIGDKIIRLFNRDVTSDKWFGGKSRNSRKRFFVLVYSSKYDKYVPEWAYDVQTNDGELFTKTFWFDDKTHSELKKEIKDYDSKKRSRDEKDIAKMEKSRDMLSRADFDCVFESDSVKACDEYYVKWCHANGSMNVKGRFGVAVGNDNGDDQMVTMAERMTKVETKIDVIGEKIDKFIDTADKRFASKLTETLVYGLVAMVLIAFITKLLNYW